MKIFLATFFLLSITAIWGQGLSVEGPDNNGTESTLIVQSGAQKTLIDGDEIDCITGALYLNSNSMNDVLLRTVTRRANVTVGHGSGTGFNRGLSIENEGDNSAYWTFYSTDGDGNLELYYKGSLRGEFNSVSGSYTTPSDRRLKEDLKPLTGILDKVQKLQPTSYRVIDDPQEQAQIGFIAQQVRSVFPELARKATIGDSDQTIYTLDYAGLSALSIAGIKELLARQNKMEQENAVLKKMLYTLEQRISQLEESDVSGTP